MKKFLIALLFSFTMISLFAQGSPGDQYMFGTDSGGNYVYELKHTITPPASMPFVGPPAYYSVSGSFPSDVYFIYTNYIEFYDLLGSYPRYEGDHYRNEVYCYFTQGPLTGSNLSYSGRTMNTFTWRFGSIDYNNGNPISINGNGCKHWLYTKSYLAGLAPVITSSTTLNHNAGDNFNYTITATGDPVITFTATGLPSYLSFNGNNSITGILPEIFANYSFSFTIGASNPFDSDSKLVKVNVTALVRAVKITSANNHIISHGNRLDYKITADGTPDISYGVSDNVSGWFNPPDKVISGIYESVDDGEVEFTVYASNPGGTDSEEITAKFQGYIDVALRNPDANNNNPDGFTFTSGNKGTATFSITNGDLLKVYTDPARTNEFEFASRDLETEGFPGTLFLKALGPVSDAKVTFKRNDLFNLERSKTFDITANGPNVAGRLVGASSYVSEANEDTASNLISQGTVIEFALSALSAQKGKHTFEMERGSPYAKIGEFFYDQACQQPVGSNPPYSVVFSENPTGPLAALVQHGAMSLFFKPMAPATDAHVKLEYSNSSGYESSDKVNFKIELVMENITGYTSLTATEPVPEVHEENTEIYQVNGPFRIDVSRGGLLTGTVRLKTSVAEKAARDVAKIYVNPDFTGDVTNASVSLENPSGLLAPLAQNGSMTLYVMPQMATKELTIDLEYVNGCTVKDTLKIKVNGFGIDITAFDTDGKAIPEDKEENPNNLIVPVYEQFKTGVQYVKLDLKNTSTIDGYISFDIDHEEGRDKAVEVYTDPELTKPLKDRVVKVDAPQGDLQSLASVDGSVALYVKPVSEASKVTARIIYTKNDPSTESGIAEMSNAAVMDIACFKICMECPCTGCPPGETSNYNNSIHFSVRLGSNNFGNSAGSINIYSDELTPDLASPDKMQFALGNGVSRQITYSGDDNDGDGNGDIITMHINTGVCTVDVTFNPVIYGNKVYYPSSIMEFYDASNVKFRTITINNNFTAEPDGSGGYTFICNSFENINTIHLSGGDSTQTAKFEKPSSGIWKLSKNNDYVEYLKTTIDSGSSTKTEVRYVGSLSSPLTTQTSVYNIYFWGDALIRYTDTETTLYEYYDNTATDALKVGKLKKVTYPKGNFTEYNYDLGGELTSTITVEGGNTYTTNRTLYQMVSINNVVGSVQRNAVSGKFDYGTLSDTDVLKILGSREVNMRYCGETLISHTESISYADRSAGPDEYIQYDENSIAHTSYTHYYSDPSNPVTYGRIWKSVNPDGTVSISTYARSGGSETVTSYSGEPDASGNTVVNGSKTVSVKNESGVTLSSQTYAVVNGSEILTGTTTAQSFDQFGRVTSTLYMDGTSSSLVYGCCGVESETARDGSVTTYIYDNTSQRLISSTRDGISTIYTYDMAGNQTEAILKGSSGTELLTRSRYLNGALYQTIDPMFRATKYENNGDKVIYPNGTTSITSYNQGVVSGVSGTAVHPLTYSYGPNWQKTMPADVTTYTDMLGRQFKTVYADGSFSQSFYNSKGQVYKQVSPGGMINLTEYDALGRVYRNAVDMNRNGVIDANDEITVYAYSYSTRGGKNVSVTTVSRVVGTDSKVLSVSENSVDGMDSWVTVNGLTSHTSVSYNGNGSVQTTVSNPDGSSSVTTSVYGKTITVQQYNNDNTPGNLVTYTYDEFNRVASITETYGSSTVNSTVYADYNANGQPGTVTVNGRATTFVYDNMGRRTSVTSPGARTVSYGYRNTGELASVSGADTYTQAYAYDAQGRMSTLTTYKDASTPQITSWIYNNRGFMTGKTYADGNGVAYGYNADGQLTLRIWARGITTAYAYDHAGRQTGIDYSDSTPDIGYTYDWMGNPATVSDATGTHVFTYDYATAGHPGLASATVPYIFNHKVEYGYDTLGKRTSMQLLNNNSPVVNHQYTYDVQNRLASVGNGTHAAHYTRLDGSGLLSNTAIKTSGGTTLLSTDRAYDAYYRMTSIASTAGATTRSYAYTYNDKDQRTICTLADGSYWEYAYDDKGQVTGGIKYDAGGIAIPGMSFGYDYDGIGNRKQETRGIEELKLHYTSNRVNQYTQITTPGVVPVAGEADADTIVKALRNDAGSPSSGEQAVIARRDGKYFTAAFTKVDNTASAKEIPYTVYAIRDDAAANKQYIQKKSSSYTVPKREQTPTYDPDGNMLTLLNDGVLWNLTWNGENRLIVAESADKRLEFTYDYMGRRVSKQVYTGSVGNWTLASESKYVYDGYYQIAEFDGSDNMLKSYLRVGGEVYAVTDASLNSTYFYMTDGNKNIMTLVDSSGNVQADYTYDPFGRIVSKSGAYADINAFRFSSEFHDTETNLVYYNYRYYSPDLGRWTKRDPIGERGGFNVYGFVGNSPISKWDHLGQNAVNNAMTSSTTRSIINTANFIENLRYDFTGNRSKYSQTIRLAMLLAASKDPVDLALATWYILGNGSSLNVPFEWFDSNGELLYDYVDYFRKKYTRDLWWYVKGTQLKFNSNQLFETQTITLSDHISDHRMISSYKTNLIFDAYIGKSCRDGKKVVWLEVNADIKVWDVTDFNSGDSFNVGIFLIPDEIAQSRAVGQAFFISSRKKVYPIYTDEKNYE